MGFHLGNYKTITQTFGGHVLESVIKQLQTFEIKGKLWIK